MDAQPEHPGDPSFGALLRRHRDAAGLTQDELAERAALSVRGLRYLEQGVRHPYRETVQRLAAALTLTPDAWGAFQAAAHQATSPTSQPADSVTPLCPEEPPLVSGPAAVPPARHNLPVQLTRFIGRAQHLTEIRHLLEERRLVTLTGAGGCGKTRLALEVAARLVERYPDGVWLVDLAPLSDPDLVLPTIAQVLGVRADGARPLPALLTEALRDRHLLVVLDNGEHLIAACATAATTLLQACPRVQILATSRAALRLAGETLRPVPPLELPDPQTVRAVESLARSEAVCLFLDRAAAVAPHLALTAATAPAVAQICTRLDGLPLALELAAARVRVLTVEELAARLDERFRLLTGGSRTALPRQQTLQATVDWSYSLLSPEEQRLFGRLSVFAGGWTLEAAEAVCTGGAIRAEDVLDLLARLVDASLVVPEEAGSRTRYRLLETLRQYGWERLVAGKEETLVQDRHALFYCALAERAEPELNGPAQLRWLDQLEREHDNLRAALAWCLDGSTPTEEAAPVVETGLRLAGALHRFWLFRAYHGEGLAWLERALARAAAAPASVRAKALLGAGVHAMGIVDLARAHELLAAAVASSRAWGDKRQLSWALSDLGCATWRSGRIEQAVEILDESLAVARTVGEPWLIAEALLHSLFRVAKSKAIERAEERARARAVGAEALHLFRTVGDAMDVAIVHLQLGQIARYEGAYQRARAAFMASLSLFRTLGAQPSVAEAVVALADVAREQGQAAQAAALYAEGLALYRAAGRSHLAPYIVGVLSRLAEIALEQGDWAQAQVHVMESLVLAREMGPASTLQLAGALEVQAALAAVQDAPRLAIGLAGAAAALRARTIRVTLPYDRAVLERRLAPVRHALSLEEQDGAWAAGQAMTPQQAIATALTGLPCSGQSPARVTMPPGTATVVVRS